MIIIKATNQYLWSDIKLQNADKTSLGQPASEAKLKVTVFP